jgi:hypothetical protein
VSISAISAGFRRCGLIASLVSGFIAIPAHAVLGGVPMTPPSGATTSGAVSHAAVAAASGASAPAVAPYTVRTTTLSSGTTVHEYLGSDGAVFGIAWRGPTIPDLPTLLGTYFPQYVQGIKAQRAQGAGRGPANVVGSDLVVRSAGHMGAFAGHAYLPQALPAGVTGRDIH